MFICTLISAYFYLFPFLWEGQFLLAFMQQPPQKRNKQKQTAIDKHKTESTKTQKNNSKQTPAEAKSKRNNRSQKAHSQKTFEKAEAAGNK